MGHSKGSPKRKVYSHECVHQKKKKKQNTERSQINDLRLHLKLLEKQEQAKPKASRRREIINPRVKINEIRDQKKRSINKRKCWVFEKINKIDKLLANLTKMRREETQINKIRNEKGEITTNTKTSRKSSGLI
jgi:hypothetical protein